MAGSIFNAHVHLNGAISLGFLEATAKRNECTELYQNFLAETDDWKKFGWIHQILKTPEDVKLATIDVVQNSNADIIEIRTTPKPMGEYAMEAYIKAFVEGLQEAERLFPQKKAKGLLSIDRSRHTLHEAKVIIDTALTQKQANHMIVGVDLSGNFTGKRTLTGNDLFQAVSYGLTKDLGLALHVGEIETYIEKDDFDLILKAIQEYKNVHPGKLYGKVRLGHAIYRTAEQDMIIAQLKLPIEICPTCHKKLGWWKIDAAHPILSLYPHRKRVLPGTDNDLIFNCNAAQEQKTVDAMLTISDKHSALSENEQHEYITAKRMRYMFK